MTFPLLSLSMNFLAYLGNAKKSFFAKDLNFAILAMNDLALRSPDKKVSSLNFATELAPFFSKYSKQFVSTR